MALVLNYMNQRKNTVISYWNVFLRMAISQPLFGIFDLFSTFPHNFLCSFRKWKANWEILKIYFCDVITLLLYLVSPVPQFRPVIRKSLLAINSFNNGILRSVSVDPNVLWIIFSSSQGRANSRRCKLAWLSLFLQD